MNDNEPTITIPIIHYRELLEIQIRSQSNFMMLDSLNIRLTNMELLMSKINDRLNQPK